MAESVVRVQRQAGEFSGRVRALREDVADLIQQLEAVNPALASSIRQMEAWRSSAQGRANPALWGQVVSQAYDTGQLSPDLQRSVQAYVTGARQPRPATVTIAPAPTAAPPPAAPTGGSITQEQRATLRQRGMSDSDIDRARWLVPPSANHPGTVMVAPPTYTAREEQEQVIPGGMRMRGTMFEGGEKVPSWIFGRRQASDDYVDSTTREERVTLRAAEAKRVGALSDRQLRYEFTQTQRELRGHERELDRLYRAEERIGEGRRTGRRQDIADEKQAVQQQQALTQERGLLLREEVTRRGGVSIGDYVQLPGGGGGGPGPFARGIGSFIAGSGLGGGGIGQTLMGGVLGTMGWGAAGPLAAGLAVRALVNRGVEANRSYMDRLRAAERTGRVTQQSGARVIENAQAAGRGYATFGIDDLLDADEATARATGMRQTPGDALNVSQVTGQTAAMGAQQFGMLTGLSPGMRGDITGRVFAEFAASSGAGTAPGEVRRINMRGQRRAIHELLPGPRAAAGVERPALMDTLAGTAGIQTDAESGGGEGIRSRVTVRGQPLSTALWPVMLQGMQRAIQAQGMSPLTRTDPAGVAASIRAASGFDMPGIEMQGEGGQPSAHGLEVGAALVGGVNQALGGGMGGVLDEARLMGVLRLRSNPDVVRRLNALGIDINTLSGLRRAMRRAPELAQRQLGGDPRTGGGGVPEVAASMYESARGMMGTSDLFEMAMGEGGRIDPEVAHVLATEPGKVRALLQPGRAQDPNLAGLATGIAGGPEVQKLWEEYLRDQFTDVALGSAIADKLGPVITKGMNDLGASLNSAISNILNESINNPPEAP